MTGPAEVREIRALARDFAATALRPDVERWDAAGGLDDSVVPRLAELGFFGMLVPESDGGMGFAATVYAAALEELAWGEPGVALLVAQSTIAADLIARHGSDALRGTWLPELATGAKTACLALSDPDGPDGAADAARAARAGDGWRLDGRKRWVTNGARADVAVVLAATEAGAVLFTAPRESGYTAGPPLQAMGFRTAPMVDLSFAGVVLDGGQLLAEHGPRAPDDDTLGRISTGAIAVGIAQAALEHAVAYAAEREQFGVAIRSFEGIQAKLADMAVRTECARTMVGRAAARAGDVTAAAMAKLTAADCAMYVTTEAVQIFGGYGYMRDYPVEKLMRDAKATQIMHGPSELQRLRIAQALYS